MAAPIITDVTNQGDGLSVLVTLAAPPVGGLTFAWSFLPAGPFSGSGGSPIQIFGPALSYTSLGGNQYRVVVRAATSNLPLPLYVVARDAGASPTDSVAVGEWIAYHSNQDDFYLAEKALHDILSDNKQLLDRALQIRLGGKTYPKGSPVETGEILRGMPFSGHEQYPLVSVRVNSYRQDVNFSGGSVDYCPLGGMIYVYDYHQGDTPREHIAQALGGKIVNLLNLNLYRELPLANGWSIAESLCHQASTEEIRDESEGVWYAFCEIHWRGNLTKGRTA